jgi:hypothetical protein
MLIDQRGGIAKCQMETERPVTTVQAADPLGLIRADTIGVRNLPVEERQGCRECEWRPPGCHLPRHRALRCALAQLRHLQSALPGGGSARRTADLEVRRARVFCVVAGSWRRDA